MPIYEYKCAKCGAGFEALVRSASDTPESCPKCGGKKLEKQFSTFAANAGGPDFTPPCSSGGCSSGSCPTGSCPFG